MNAAATALEASQGCWALVDEARRRAERTDEVARKRLEGSSLNLSGPATRLGVDTLEQRNFRSQSCRVEELVVCHDDAGDPHGFEMIHVQLDDGTRWQLLIKLMTIESTSDPA